jgi:hypothetical protein
MAAKKKSSARRSSSSSSSSSSGAQQQKGVVLDAATGDELHVRVSSGGGDDRAVSYGRLVVSGSAVKFEEMKGDNQ